VEQEIRNAYTSNSVPHHVDPYTVPTGQHGWRGLSISGDHKRKWYTVLHNDTVLVTALLLLPGERSIRHSHESGELSIHFDSALRPLVSWNPPGALHGGTPVRTTIADAVAQNVAEQEQASRAGSADLGFLIDRLDQLQEQMRELQRQLDERTRPAPAPRVLIDILFPPFKTTIDDPEVPEGRTVVGQWFD
jgi:hypothetical protein